MATHLRPTFLGAATGGGILAWGVGYVLTYAVVAGRLRDSVSTQLLELIEEGAFVPEFVGWVYFNAHFVGIVQDFPIGGTVSSYVGGDGFTPLLYVVPIGLLVAGGLALARLDGVTDPTAGVVRGVLLTPGYFVAALLGRTLTRVEVSTFIGSASGAPELLPALLIGGVLYPAVFGGLGGLIGAVTAGSSVT